ncbi:hypothetical protein EH165_12405 [Nakamurella antarctica]|uniref:Uncharacterized protein n=1 Tax=Nakamurella antarctica TaxID=1902245 RepID=A0A3G8ZNW1_9ACTN|nr:hypothetical protein [Nakamurella antarctica]AZI58818.1 hypothetical protein EH165_12405 [Nakamurella antarctica]
MHLDQLGSSYQVAGDGFVTYAAVVADIAVRAEGFRAAGASADRDKSRAVSAQGAWVDPVVAVNAAVVANAAAGGVLVAPVPVVAGVNPHDEAVRVAAARLQAATDSLHELGGERRSADDRVQGSLEAAHQVGMQNRSAWSHFWEDLSSVLAVITIVLLVVAVVVLFVVAGPAAWAAAGAASGFVASAAAGAAAAGAAMAGVGTAMTVVGAAALGVHSVQAVRGEASWADVGVEALWQLGPGVALKGLKYFGDAARGLKAGAAAEDAAAGLTQARAGSARDAASAWASRTTISANAQVAGARAYGRTVLDEASGLVTSRAGALPGGGSASVGTTMSEIRSGASAARASAIDDALTGPVVFRPPRSGYTEAQHVQAQEAVDGANKALKNGQVASEGRVATSKDQELLRAKDHAVAAEKKLKASEGDPYLPGQHVGHNPDAMWTGKGESVGPWLRQDAKVNLTMGSQGSKYPEHFKPTEFRYERGS